jgi:hypothetical protein
MTRRTRKLIGAFVVVGYVVLYALVAMALAQAAPLQEASKLVQGISYAVLGLAWILPLMPLISWMERKDPEDPA